MAVHSTSNRNASLPRTYQIDVDRAERVGRRAEDERQVDPPLLVGEPVEQVAVIERAVVLAAGDPRAQLEPVRVVGQRRDDPGVVVAAPRRRRPRSPASRARPARRTRPGRPARAPRRAPGGRGRGGRCARRSRSRRCGRRSTGSTTSTTRRGRPAGARPARAQRSHHCGRLSSPMRTRLGWSSRHSSSRTRLASSCGPPPSIRSSRSPPRRPRARAGDAAQQPGATQLGHDGGDDAQQAGRLAPVAQQVAGAPARWPWPAPGRSGDRPRRRGAAGRAPPRAAAGPRRSACAGGATTASPARPDSRWMTSTSSRPLAAAPTAVDSRRSGSDPSMSSEHQPPGFSVSTADASPWRSAVASAPAAWPPPPKIGSRRRVSAASRPEHPRGGEVLVGQLVDRWARRRRAEDEVDAVGRQVLADDRGPRAEPEHVRRGHPAQLAEVGREARLVAVAREGGDRRADVVERLLERAPHVHLALVAARRLANVAGGDAQRRRRARDSRSGARRAAGRRRAQGAWRPPFRGRGSRTRSSRRWHAARRGCAGCTGRAAPRRGRRGRRAPGSEP